MAASWRIRGPGRPGWPGGQRLGLRVIGQSTVSGSQPGEHRGGGTRGYIRWMADAIWILGAPSMDGRGNAPDRDRRCDRPDRLVCRRRFRRWRLLAISGLVRKPSDLHGMHQARGSSPLSLTFRRSRARCDLKRCSLNACSPRFCARKICRPTALSRHSVNPGISRAGSVPQVRARGGGTAWPGPSPAESGGDVG